MADTKILEDKIRALESRVKDLEDILSTTEYLEDKEFMDALHKKAKCLVENTDQVSVIWLQRKLIIDFPRAQRLYNRLKSEGVLS